MKKYNVIEGDITYSIKEYSNGTKFWYLNDKRHRENGPAVEYDNGDKEWYLNGKYHRINGPAIECADGYRFWYLNDKLHRINGPAVEYDNGDKVWYYQNTEIHCKNLKEFNRQIKLLSIS